MRGEYWALTARIPSVVELPPRARRIHRMARGHLGFQGTTSACAENTLRHHSTRMLCGNYLRVRGEYARSRSLRGGRGELPPRARRIRCARPHDGHGRGTTSACAENTWRARHKGIPARNYLRVRGEYTKKAEKTSLIVELPPRARRILAEAVSAVAPLGTTSACAENTV